MSEWLLSSFGLGHGQFPPPGSFSLPTTLQMAETLLEHGQGSCGLFHSQAGRSWPSRHLPLVQVGPDTEKLCLHLSELDGGRQGENVSAILGGGQLARGTATRTVDMSISGEGTCSLAETLGRKKLNSKSTCLSKRKRQRQRHTQSERLKLLQENKPHKPTKTNEVMGVHSIRWQNYQACTKRK